MPILEMVSSAFAFVYLVFILEIIFTSTKNVLYNQQAFEGRMLFFIYSLFVYYKGISVDIFFFDDFLNRPIIQAYELIDAFMANFLGLPISNSPAPIFLYLLPASFIYHFTEYWFRYGFNDERIGRLTAFLAVVLFVNGGGFMGLLPAGVPWGAGIAGFIPLFLWMFERMVPVADLGAAATRQLEVPLVGGMLASEIMQLVGYLIFLVLILVLFYYLGRAMFNQMLESSGMGTLVLLLVTLFIGLLGGSLAVNLLLYGLQGANFLDILLGRFLKLVYFLSIVLGIAFLTELLTLGVIYTILKNVRMALGVKTGPGGGEGEGLTWGGDPDAMAGAMAGQAGGMGGGGGGDQGPPDIYS